MACMIDFRCLDEGLGGKTYKRKRQSQSEDSMDVDETVPPVAKRSAVGSAENPDKPSFGMPSYDGVIAGKVSGRKWKQARSRRSSAVVVSRKGKSLEQRSHEKQLKRAFRERKEELKEEIRRNKVEKRRLREEREKKKKDNILKSGTKLQKITNPNTLNKIAKSKQRKLLKVVPDNMFSKN